MPGDGAWKCATARVPAKVNLFLAVRGRRQDGYHEVVTVMQTLSVYDRLVARLVGPPGQGHHPAARRRMQLELVAPPDVPGALDNLAVVAARRLGEATGLCDLATLPTGDDVPRTLLNLDKAIPVAGGMAGGSADAAAALVVLNELWDCGLSREDLRVLAADVGSDVPFCLVGGTAIATGRGTTVAQVLAKGTFHWVVCQAHERLETAAVYQAWDRHCQPSEIEPDAVLQALRSQDPEALGAALHNDLETAAFALRPELADDKQTVCDAGALGAVVSGSGPTLVGLAADAAHASALAARLRPHFRTVTVAHSPAGGPEIHVQQ